MPTTGVVYVAVAPDRCILVQLRDDGRGEQILYKNTWAFPGGRVEGSETSREAVAREYSEECSRVGEFRYIGTYQYSGEGPLNGGFVDVFFTFVEEAFDTIHFTEGKKFEWMEFEKLMKLELAWQQEKIIPMIKEALSRAQ